MNERGVAGIIALSALAITGALAFSILGIARRQQTRLAYQRDDLRAVMLAAGAAIVERADNFTRGEHVHAFETGRVRTERTIEANGRVRLACHVESGRARAAVVIRFRRTGSRWTAESWREDR